MLKLLLTLKESFGNGYLIKFLRVCGTVWMQLFSVLKVHLIKLTHFICKLTLFMYKDNSKNVIKPLKHTFLSGICECIKIFLQFFNHKDLENTIHEIFFLKGFFQQNISLKANFLSQRGF